MRIGFGYDVHQLKEGIPLRLGGIHVPHTKGSAGHSDADVLIHAICDSLLGALGLGDIGNHFPDTDPAYKGIDSKILLGKVMELIGANGYSVVNIDTTICLQNPKISPYIGQMRSVLAGLLKIAESDISIKATTKENLGFIGRGEGIEAYSVALLEKNNK